jgi:hypothetical protein
MDTAVNMQIVGSEMQHIEDLRALLEPLVGAMPAISTRLEITVNGQTTVITLNDAMISVQDEGKMFQGDWELAQAALAGFEPPPTG